MAAAPSGDATVREASPDALETPSGKSAATENFPVASLLISARLRPHIGAFYAFVRAADDIADNADLAPDDKLRRLGRLEAGLLADAADVPAKAAALRVSLSQTGVTPRHALDVLDAFKQDAVQTRYADWAELIAYCNRSAAPVGRYLLDLHGEARSAYRESDALCNALQIINHLQDCADDYRQLDRVYLPQDWLVAEGCDVSALRAPAAAPTLRAVLDRTLAGVEVLLETARRLPFVLRSRRLALESAVIVAIAERLTARMRTEDPLAHRVKLSKREAGACAVIGCWRQARGRWRR